MAHGQDLLQALAIVLGVAALMALLCQRLRQPVVLGYIVAGLIIGPYTPIPLVADSGVVRTLSELGVILLMFSIGLEFRISRAMKLGTSALLTAVIETSIVLWLGFVVGRLFGWTVLESLFAGSALAISSTTIIVKAFNDLKVRDRLREVVIGILLVEDLIAIIMLAVLTPIGRGAGVSAESLGATGARLFAFLVALIVIGYLLVPRATRAVLRRSSRETILVSAIAFCFATAVLARQFGYSVALGAFMAGSLVSESGRARRIEELVEPVRDMFAAVFFVSVGMMLDPRILIDLWPAVVALTLVVLLGKTCGVSVSAFLTGNDVRTSVRAGMSMSQIGEFSFIIVSLGLVLGAVRPFLYSVAVATSAITALLTPLMIRYSPSVAATVERRMPRTLGTYASLYGTWITSMQRNLGKRGGPSIKRIVLLLVVDVLVLFGLIIATAVSSADIGTLIGRRVGVSVIVARSIVLAAAAVLAVPLWLGIVRLARRLSILLAERAFPAAAPNEPDLNAAPRGALIVTIKLLLLLIIGMPLVAFTQPFLPGYPAAVALTLLLAFLVAAFWRTAGNVEGHVRAGSQAVVSALAKRSKGDTDPTTEAKLAQLLSPFGSPAAVVVSEGSDACGRSLEEIDLRGRTRAVAVAIQRGDEHLLMPSAKETLQAGDIVAVAGPEDAVEEAVALLTATSG